MYYVVDFRLYFLVISGVKHQFDKSNEDNVVDVDGRSGDPKGDKVSDQQLV